MDAIILHEDAELLVVSKPPGVPVIPARDEDPAASLVRRLEAGYGRLYVVHRIDRGTSGVVLFARSEAAHRFLCLQFENGRAAKTYHAITAGSPAWKDNECALALLPDGDRRHRTVVDQRCGKPSHTRFAVEEAFRGFALLRAEPASGRTHQIRVHLSALGLPLLCDELYGAGRPLMLSSLKPGFKKGSRTERPLLARLALHASALVVEHPGAGTSMRFEAGPPDDFETALVQLRKWRSAP